MKETQAINKSLSALGDVMAAIVRRDPHVPYRNSKLTYLLQPCLGNQAKTLMILNLAPDTASAPETLCSARFGEKVRGRERSRPLLSWLLPLLNSGQVGRAVYIYSLTHYARPPTRESSVRKLHGAPVEGSPLTLSLSTTPSCLCSPSLQAALFLRPAW